MQELLAWHKKAYSLKHRQRPAAKEQKEAVFTPLVKEPQDSSRSQF